MVWFQCVFCRNPPLAFIHIGVAVAAAVYVLRHACQHITQPPQLRGKVGLRSDGDKQEIATPCGLESVQPCPVAVAGGIVGGFGNKQLAPPVPPAMVPAGNGRIALRLHKEPCAPVGADIVKGDDGAFVVVKDKVAQHPFEPQEVTVIGQFAAVGNTVPVCLGQMAVKGGGHGLQPACGGNIQGDIIACGAHNHGPVINGAVLANTDTGQVTRPGPVKCGLPDRVIACQIHIG